MPTRASSTVRECPVTTRHTSIGTPVLCGARVPGGRLMCVDHWRRVPPHLRTPVLSTWRRWSHTHDPDDWAEYLVAREFALDSVGARLTDEPVQP